MADVAGWPPRWLTPVPIEDQERGDGELYANFAEAVCRVTKDSVASPAGKLLIELCEKMDRKYELQAKMAQSDFVLYTDKGYAYANPLFGMLNTVEGDIIKLLSLLGLTPIDRSKLGVAEVTTKGKLAQLLEQQKKNV